MFEKAIRGGISQVCDKKYAKANNKYLPGFDTNKQSTYTRLQNSGNKFSNILYP